MTNSTFANRRFNGSRPVLSRRFCVLFTSEEISQPRFQIKHSNDIDSLNVNINQLNEQFYKEVSKLLQFRSNDTRHDAFNSFNSFHFTQNIEKDDQLNLLRDANLQLRGQVFDLNQDIVDLLEIVESLKNRRMVSDSSFIAFRAGNRQNYDRLSWRSAGRLPTQSLQQPLIETWCFSSSCSRSPLVRPIKDLVLNKLKKSFIKYN